MIILVNEDKISDEKYERIKKHIHDYSYIDLVIWRNEMVVSGIVNNRLFKLLNDEIERRAKELGLYEPKKSNK